MEIADLVGQTLVRCEKSGAGDEMIFVTDTGRIFKQNHSQDCCESVYVEDIIGDLSDLIGSPITEAEEVTYSGDDSGHDNKWPEDVPEPDFQPESYTWTFYKLATAKGGVTIRWYGTSNGYYSERVDFYEARAA